MRVDTTVVETNIHYPTDSSLLGDGVRGSATGVSTARSVAALRGDARLVQSPSICSWPAMKTACAPTWPVIARQHVWCRTTSRDQFLIPHTGGLSRQQLTVLPILPSSRRRI